MHMSGSYANLGATVVDVRTFVMILCKAAANGLSKAASNGMQNTTCSVGVQVLQLVFCQHNLLHAQQSLLLNLRLRVHH